METYIESNRGTGRTYRMLLQSLLAASQGEKVAVCGFSHAHAVVLHRRAMGYSNFEADSSRSQLTIKFPNGGCVYFTCPSDIELDLHSRSVSKVLRDEE